jgi:hypothetical protein
LTNLATVQALLGESPFRGTGAVRSAGALEQNVRDDDGIVDHLVVAATLRDHGGPGGIALALLVEWRGCYLALRIGI